jgi:hypothetical protein
MLIAGSKNRHNGRSRADGDMHRSRVHCHGARRLGRNSRKLPKVQSSRKIHNTLVSALENRAYTRNLARDRRRHDDDTYAGCAKLLYKFPVRVRAQRFAAGACDRTQQYKSPGSETVLFQYMLDVLSGILFRHYAHGAFGRRGMDTEAAQQV